MADAVLVHVAAGIGNIVLATPLIAALHEIGLTIDLRVSADYAGTANLFRDWSTVRRVVDLPEGGYAAYVPAVPPFYWHRYRAHYDRIAAVVPRPPDALFWSDEQEYYLAFARALGYRGRAPMLRLPIAPVPSCARAPGIVLAPGCKTGEMAAKRWPSYPELAARFNEVTVVGTPDDLKRWDGSAMRFPESTHMLTGGLGLRDTAEMIAAAAVVVANDSGLGHLSAALGVPTIMLFGPTPDRTLGRFPPNVTVMRAGLSCEPCWFSDCRFRACGHRVDCLRAISVDAVERAVKSLVPALGTPPSLLRDAS